MVLFMYKVKVERTAEVCKYRHVFSGVILMNQENRKTNLPNYLTMGACGAETLIV